MTQDLFGYFKGTWLFEREILWSDSKKNYGRADGSASWEVTEQVSVLQYQETGKLLIFETQHQQAFFRNYKYNITEEGLDIYFDDALTQNFNLYQQYIYQHENGKLVPKATHVCNKDLYEGDFTLTNEHHFIHASVIKGPHKDYTIITRYTKQL